MPRRRAGAGPGAVRIGHAGRDEARPGALAPAVDVVADALRLAVAALAEAARGPVAGPHRPDVACRGSHNGLGSLPAGVPGQGRARLVITR